MVSVEAALPSTGAPDACQGPAAPACREEAQRVPGLCRGAGGLQGAAALREDAWPVTFRRAEGRSGRHPARSSPRRSQTRAVASGENRYLGAAETAGEGPRHRTGLDSEYSPGGESPAAGAGWGRRSVGKETIASISRPRRGRQHHAGVGPDSHGPREKSYLRPTPMRSGRGPGLWAQGGAVTAHALPSVWEVKAQGAQGSDQRLEKPGAGALGPPEGSHPTAGPR